VQWREHQPLPTPKPLAQLICWHQVCCVKRPQPRWQSVSSQEGTVWTPATGWLSLSVSVTAPRDKVSDGLDALFVRQGVIRRQPALLPQMVAVYIMLTREDLPAHRRCGLIPGAVIRCCAFHLTPRHRPSTYWTLTWYGHHLLSMPTTLWKSSAESKDREY